MKNKLTKAIPMLVLAAAAGSASARNDKLLLGIEPALRSPNSQQALSRDVALRFGKSSAQGLENLGSTQSNATVLPSGAPNNNNGGRPEPRSDESACQDA